MRKTSSIRVLCAWQPAASNCAPVPARSIRQMVDEYHKQGWPLHVLLNNAGIQVRGWRVEPCDSGACVSALCLHVQPHAA